MKRAENQTAVAKGKVTFGALGIFKPKTKRYYSQRVTALLKSWPGLEKTDIRKISKTDSAPGIGRPERETSRTAWFCSNRTGTRLFPIAPPAPRIV
jgi:hypothetical protein